MNSNFTTVGITSSTRSLTEATVENTTWQLRYRRCKKESSSA